MIEIFAPSFLMIIFIFFECSLYMKAGTIIVKSGSTNTKNNKRNEEMAKNSEWFFDKEREANRIKRTAENNIEENIEENVEPIKGISISNILIAWIVVIAVILVVYLIQDMRKDEFANEISNAITNQNIPTIDNDKNTLAESRIPVREESNTSSLFEVEETDERLIGIVNKFNNSEAAANMFIQGYILTSIASGNELIVYGSGAGVNTNVTYTLNGDILSTVIEDDTDSRISVLRVLHAMFLLDSVGQYKGYPERTIINAFNEEKSKYYTIENEGIELKEDPVTGDVTIKVDLSKDFSFLNNN